MVVVVLEVDIIYSFKFVFEDWVIVNFGVGEGEDVNVVVLVDKVLV